MATSKPPSAAPAAARPADAKPEAAKPAAAKPVAAKPVAARPPAAKPAPVPVPVTRPFWDGTASGELRLQTCGACAAHVFYARPRCPRCGADALSWVRASGRGRLHSYVISHMEMPGWAGETPYVIAIVELEEGPRMMSSLVGVPADPAHLQLDMPLEVVFEKRGEMTLPMFKPAEAA